jgi:6-phospho 3-hexuloisomerase
VKRRESRGRVRNPATNRPGGGGKLGLVIDEIVSHLERVGRELSQSESRSLIDEIESANRIFVYGAGRSGYVARSFAQRLKQMGFDAFFVGDTTTPASGKGDLLIAVTGSGETPSVISMLETGKTLGVRQAVVTSNRDGRASRMAHLTLYVPGKTKLLERPTHAPFTSLFDVAALSVLDGITAELMQGRGLNDEDIGRAHANLE